MRGFLLETLPKNISIDNKTYEIPSDFRQMMEMEGILASEKDEATKAMEALTFFYGEIPKNDEAAVEWMCWFYRCGEEMKETDAAPQEKGVYRSGAFSLMHDGEMIYAAFLAQYHINLLEIPYLHWWDFQALFHGLSKAHLIWEVIHCRTVDITNDMPKEKREYYQKMKKIYALPLPKHLKLGLSELEEALMGKGSVTDALKRLE